MTDEQIKYMRDRFLGWPLPEPWHPDGGISFEPLMNKGTKHEMKRDPSGTNLFDAEQAEAMIRFMVEGLQPSPQQELKSIKRYGVTADCTFPLAKQVNIPQPDTVTISRESLERVREVLTIFRSWNTQSEAVRCEALSLIAQAEGKV